jgi:hypothetical protein
MTKATTTFSAPQENAKSLVFLSSQRADGRDKENLDHGDQPELWMHADQ